MSYTYIKGKQFFGEPDITSSFAISASYALSSSKADSSNTSITAQTASYNISSSYAITSSYSATASYIANLPATASNAISASYANAASYAITSSYSNTSSFSQNSITASYALNNIIFNNYIAKEVVSGSIDGINTAFNLVNTPVSNSEMVFLNGILQIPPTDYSITGSLINFAIAPFNGDKIVSTYATSSLIKYIANENPSGIIDGINTIFSVLYIIQIDTESVFLNGILQVPIIDYTITTSTYSTITFITAPFSGDTIRITYMKT